MSGDRMAWVHRCGTHYFTGAANCPGCGMPVLPPISEDLRAMATEMEGALGLTQLRISLLGIVSSAYIAGWETARDQFEAVLPVPEVPAVPDVPS